jgi:hypothetical protein
VPAGASPPYLIPPPNRLRQLQSGSADKPGCSRPDRQDKVGNVVDFSGKTVVVTGASRGIGESIAYEFAALTHS